MANSADILASAGIDLDAFDAGVEKLIAKLDKLDANSEKREKSKEDREKKSLEREIAREDKAAKKEEDRERKKQELKKKLIIGVTAAASAQFVANLAEGGAEASKLTATLQKLDPNQFKAVYTEADAAATAIRNIGGAALGVVKAVPYIGPALDAAFGGFAKVAQDTQDQEKGIHQEADSLDALAGKLKNIETLRANARNAGDHGERLADEEQEFTKARLDIQTKYLAASKEQLALGRLDVQGAEHELALNQAELATKQKIASLSESLKNPLGHTSDEGNKIKKEGIKLILQEQEFQTRGIKLQLEQERTSLTLNEAEETRGITIKDQNARLDYQKDALEEQIPKVEKLYGVHSLIASQLRNQLHQNRLASAELDNQINKELHAARLEITSTEAELAGNKKLAAIAKVRQKYEVEIAAALREGKTALAAQKTSMQALALLAAKVADIRKTPQQRRDEKKEQKAQDKAIRLVNAREKGRAQAEANGAYGYHSNRDHVSPATARAVAEMQARAAGGGAKGGLTTGTLKVVHIEAGSFTVKSLQHN